MSEVLVLRRSDTRPTQGSSKTGVNSKRTVCTNDDDALEELKLKGFKKAEKVHHFIECHAF